LYYLGQKPGSCPPNMARCGNSTKCEYIEVFCDGQTHCENNTDEGSFCGKLVKIIFKLLSTSNYF
jgi:hypothetical protein